MNFSAIVLSTLLICNGTPAEPVANNAIQPVENRTMTLEVNELTLMEGYDRYLNDPKFDLSISRHA